MVSGRLVASVMLAALAGCESPERDFPPYRYRLSVDVQTPEGVRSGSTVIEVNTYRQGPIPRSVVVSRATGAAVVIDLGSRGNLFALLSSPNDYEWAEHIMSRVAKNQLPYNLKKPNGWVPAPRELVTIPRMLPAILMRSKPTSGYPYMARFRNPKDWGSMELVNPDDLAASFGEGVRMLRVTAQITDDAVTTQALQALPRPYDLLSAADVEAMRLGEQVKKEKKMYPSYFFRGIKDSKL